MTRALAVALALVAGCKDGGKGGKDERTAPGPAAPPVTLPERQRASDACSTYVSQLCACAERRPELAESCRLKQAKVEAIGLTLAVIDDPASAPDAVTRARAEMVKVVARCIEEAAQLPALGCPAP